MVVVTNHSQNTNSTLLFRRVDAGGIGNYSDNMVPRWVDKIYEVESTTMDAYISRRDFKKGTKVVKIDVEGWEVHVLRGAGDLVERDRPALSIDIHRAIDGQGDTEGAVRDP